MGYDMMFDHSCGYATQQTQARNASQRNYYSATRHGMLSLLPFISFFFGKQLSIEERLQINMKERGWLTNCLGVMKRGVIHLPRVMKSNHKYFSVFNLIFFSTHIIYHSKEMNLLKSFQAYCYSHNFLNQTL